MKRYEKFVLEAEKGITFEVSEGTSGELIIRALNNASNNVCSGIPTVSAGEYAKVLSIYIDKDGNKAIVPPGWTVSGREQENTIWGKDTSLVIYSIPQEIGSDINWSIKQEIENLQKAYNQMVWAPVEKLDRNGTLDGINFTERFGRRNYMNDKFSNDKFHEALYGELIKQSKSAKKYGGFYISRYNISIDSTGKVQSVKGAMPWIDSFYTAEKIASTFEDNEAVKSHLTLGAEYDSILEWLIETESKTLDEIANNSTEWGNYDNKFSLGVLETGSREEWCANNIYDFAGNSFEWTQEQYGKGFGNISDNVIRGGNAYNNGNSYPVAYRFYIAYNSNFNNAGFRATLYIK